MAEILTDDGGEREKDVDTEENGENFNKKMAFFIVEKTDNFIDKRIGEINVEQAD